MKKHLIFLQMGLFFSAPIYAKSVDGKLMVLAASMKDGSEKTIYQVHTEDGEILELEGKKTARLPRMSELPIRVEIEPSLTAPSHLTDFEILADIEAERSERLAAPVRHAVMYVIDTATKKASTDWSTDAIVKSWGEVDSFYKSVSLGLISFPMDGNGDGKPDIYGPFNVPGSSCSTFQTMSTKAQALASQIPGAEPANFTNIINILPAGIGCDWLGLGYVGCKDECELWSSAKPQSPSVVFNHELGHNFGLDHASTDTNDDGRKEVEYGDWSDVMGNRFDAIETFGPAHHEQLGWYSLKGDGWLVSHPKGTSTYNLRALASYNGTAQAVKLPRSKGGSYYVSYRYAEGLDAKIDARYANQVTVHSWTGKAQTSYILSIKPGYQVVLGKATIKFLKASGNTATVEITTL